MKKGNDTKERLLALLDDLGLTQTQFEEQCELSKGFASRITRNVRKGSLEKIKAHFPKVNINWLKTGKGSMYSAVVPDETIHDRLVRYLKAKGITARSFETKAQLSTGAVARADSSMRTTTLYKIKEAFPDINENWILTGIGKMYSSERYVDDLMTVKDRLRVFVNHLGVSESFFFTKCKINANKITHLSDNFPLEYFDKIAAAYPMLNIEWLRNGKGKMLKEAVRKSTNIRMIPVVSQRAYAGYLSGFANNEYIATLPTIPYIVESEQEHDNFIAFEVRGDSMDDDTPDAYKDGDILICKQLELDLYKFAPLPYKRRDFVIIHKEGVLIKRIIAHDVEKHLITIHSLSDDPTYEDRVLDLADVMQLFTVEYQQRKRYR